MQVTVRFYGIVGDLARTKSVSIELAEDATVTSAIDMLSGSNPGFGAVAGQVRAVVDGQNATRETVLHDGAEVILMRAIGGGAGHAIIHSQLPIIPSPSGLPSQHIITADTTGATSIFVGQQWLQPGDRVLLHTHPVEEAVTFLRGSGEATLEGVDFPFGPGASLYFPAGAVHGFRNTGVDELHVMIVFPCPFFAETTLVERATEIT